MVAAAEGAPTPDGVTAVRFDTKIAVLLRDDLASWQRLNVTAFLVSGIAGTQPEVLGEPYTDADGTPYLPMFRQPVLVFSGDASVLTAAHVRAVSRALPMTQDLQAGKIISGSAACHGVPPAWRPAQR